MAEAFSRKRDEPVAQPLSNEDQRAIQVALSQDTQQPHVNLSEQDRIRRQRQQMMLEKRG